MSAITCNPVNSTINEYTGASKPWNTQRIHHLYNRLDFGASPQDIQAGLNTTPAQLIDNLINDAINAAPSYQDLYDRILDTDDNVNNHYVWSECFRDFSQWALNQSIHAKMVLFWSGHLVVNVYQNGPSAEGLLEYYYLLHKYAFGNFKDFVIEMGLTYSMLRYLDGSRSTVDSPNQNYPRELLELFTMGIKDKYGNDNYTQADIEAVARILTGWHDHEFTTLGEKAFNPGCHDWGTKDMTGTDYLLGFTVTPPTPATPPPNACDWRNGSREIGNPTNNPPDNMAAAYQEYLDFHNQLFTVKANEISWFICKKIYQYFVSHDIDSDGEARIDDLAQTFRDNNWEIAPVLRQLFKSEHFFEEKYIGIHIKNPFEFFVSLPRKVALIATGANPFGISGMASAVGQRFLRPPDVSGWDEHHSWITQYSLAKRWSGYDSMLTSNINNDIREDLRQLAEDLTLAVNNDPADFTDPDKVVRALADHFFTVDLQDKQMGKAVVALRGSTPPFYFTGPWSVTGLGYSSKPEVSQQIIDVLIFFTRQPEFNLS